nr:60S acidic ribosomal protein P1-like isoform X2 [Globicephala melas]
MASVLELARIYLALILHNDEVTVTEDKINALANVNIGLLMCNVRTGGPAPAADAALAGGPAPSITAAPAEEKKAETKKEESEESYDGMCFGLFD